MTTAHLRVGGGAMCEKTSPKGALGASPRGRRSRSWMPEQERIVWRISAWAEEPFRDGEPGWHVWAHLRVGGGAAILHADMGGQLGASPRGRRSPTDRLSVSPRCGRISAWAEEPSCARSRRPCARRISAWAEEPRAPTRASVPAWHGANIKTAVAAANGDRLTRCGCQRAQPRTERPDPERRASRAPSRSAGSAPGRRHHA